MMELEDLVPKEPDWLPKQTILLGKTGSHAYGTATKDSDLDFKGIVIPPPSYFLGLDSFTHYDKKDGANVKNKAGDIDVTLLHINKFVLDCLAGTPNNLELLFLEEDDYVHLDHRGLELISIREQFLSKQVMKKFGGYAKSQTAKMKDLKSNGAARADLVEKYGYDTKFYMHTVRLYTMAIEILTEHTLSVRRPNAKFLLELREGCHTLEQALANIELFERLLQVAYKQSTLRDVPDINYIGKWLVDFNTRHSVDAFRQEEEME